MRDTFLRRMFSFMLGFALLWAVARGNIFPKALTSPIVEMFFVTFVKILLAILRFFKASFLYIEGAIEAGLLSML